MDAMGAYQALPEPLRALIVEVGAEFVVGVGERVLRTAKGIVLRPEVEQRLRQSYRGAVEVVVAAVQRKGWSAERIELLVHWLSLQEVEKQFACVVDPDRSPDMRELLGLFQIGIGKDEEFMELIQDLFWDELCSTTLQTLKDPDTRIATAAILERIPRQLAKVVPQLLTKREFEEILDERLRQIVSQVGEKRLPGPAIEELAPDIVREWAQTMMRSLLELGPRASMRRYGPVLYPMLDGLVGAMNVVSKRVRDYWERDQLNLRLEFDLRTTHAQWFSSQLSDIWYGESGSPGAAVITWVVWDQENIRKLFRALASVHRAMHVAVVNKEKFGEQWQDEHLELLHDALEADVLSLSKRVGFTEQEAAEGVKELHQREVSG